MFNNHYLFMFVNTKIQNYSGVGYRTQARGGAARTTREGVGQSSGRQNPCVSLRTKARRSLASRGQWCEVVVQGMHGARARSELG